MNRLGPIAERAKRIKHIRAVKKSWQESWIWRNHLTASHEFQLLDVLRDIRWILMVIAILLLLIFLK